MKSITKILTALVLAVVTALSPSVASAAPMSVPASVVTSENMALVQQMQARYRQSASDADYQKAVAEFQRMLSNPTSPKSLSDSSIQSFSGDAHSVKWCLSIPKWAFQAYCWYVIIQGGATAAVGGFLEVRIVGAPAGAVLNALGIAAGTTGSFGLWWADQVSWPR